MCRDIHLQRLLDDINAFIDDMPAAGSTEYLRFAELVEEFLSYSDTLDGHFLLPERDRLRRELDAVQRRRHPEGKAP
jgi:hypothetical protein